MEYGKVTGSVIGNIRNLESGGEKYSKKSVVQETKYFVCPCGAFGSTWNCNLKWLVCSQCDEDVVLLFNSPRISNTFNCKLCWREWKSNTLHKFNSFCKYCGEKAETQDIFYSRLYKEVSDVKKAISGEKLEVSQDFDVSCDKLREKIIKIAKEIK